MKIVYDPVNGLAVRDAEVEGQYQICIRSPYATFAFSTTNMIERFFIEINAGNLPPDKIQILYNGAEAEMGEILLASAKSIGGSLTAGG